MLHSCEVHLLKADQKELVLILLPLRAHQKVHKTGIRRVVDHVRKVHVTEEIRIVIPGRTHRDHENLAVLQVRARIESECLRVDIDQRRLTRAAETREYHEIVALDRRVEVDKVTALIVATALLRVVLHHIENQCLVFLGHRNLRKVLLIHRILELCLQLGSAEVLALFCLFCLCRLIVGIAIRFLLLIGSKRILRCLRKPLCLGPRLRLPLSLLLLLIFHSLQHSAL